MGTDYFTVETKGIVGLVLAGLLAVAAPAAAQDGAPPVLSDPAYDRYVDIDLLANAWSQRNAELLTDLALQLAEGERVLQRPRKGINADQVFGAAVKVAADSNDKMALARIEKALTNLNKNELAAQAKMAQQLAAKSRAPDPSLNVSVETTPSAVFLLLKDTVDAIKAARLAQNSKGLEVIIKEIPQMKELSETQRRTLLKQATQAQADVPKDAREVDPSVDALNKLSAESRHGGGHAGGGHPGGGHAGGGHPGGGHTGGGHPGGWHTGGGHTGAHAGMGRGRPGRFHGMQGHWHRHFSPRYSCYLFWDPYYGCYYFYDDSCGCYLLLQDDSYSGD
jgi:hypothetical protein